MFDLPSNAAAFFDCDHNEVHLHSCQCKHFSVVGEQFVYVVHATPRSQNVRSYVTMLFSTRKQPNSGLSLAWVHTIALFGPNLGSREGTCTDPDFWHDAKPSIHRAAFCQLPHAHG